MLDLVIVTEADDEMSGASDLAERLARVLKLQPFRLGAFLAQSVTPAHRFTDIIRVADDLVQVSTARDFFDPDLAEGMMRAVNVEDTRRAQRTTLTILDGLSLGSFDSLGLLGPCAHDSFKTQDPLLHESTVVMFPMYRCEFSGNEDSEQVRLLRQRFISTLDWTRKPAPKVEMRFLNTKTKARSKGSGFGLVDVPYLLHELKELRGSAGAYVEIRKYGEEPIKGRWDEGRYQVENVRLGETSVTDEESLAQLIDQFLCGRSPR